MQRVAWTLVWGIGLSLSAGLLAADPASPPAKSAATGVRLVIDYGDGVEKHFTALPWRAEMTVLDCLRAAQAMKHGIQVVSRGSGEIAFVSQIDDLKNEGGAADGKNWFFSVNEKTADRSCGIFQVQSGDRVVWRFGSFEQDEASGKTSAP